MKKIIWLLCLSALLSFPVYAKIVEHELTPQDIIKRGWKITAEREDSVVSFTILLPGKDGNFLSGALASLIVSEGNKLISSCLLAPQTIDGKTGVRFSVAERFLADSQFRYYQISEPFPAGDLYIVKLAKFFPPKKERAQKDDQKLPGDQACEGKRLSEWIKKLDVKDTKLRDEVAETVMDLYATSYADLCGDIMPEQKKQFDIDLVRAKKAEQKLVAMGKQSLPILIKVLPQTGWSGRIPRVLIKINDSSCIPSLLEEAKKQKVSVFPAIVHFNAKEAIPIFIQILGQENIPNANIWNMRNEAVEALRKLTNQNFNFDCRKSKRAQKRSIARWQKWWDENKEGILKKEKPEIDAKVLPDIQVLIEAVAQSGEQRPALSLAVVAGIVEELSENPKLKDSYAKLVVKNRNVVWFEGIDELIKARAVYCLTSGLCHPHRDVQIRCAESFLMWNIPKNKRIVPFILEVAKSNSIPVSGSENATLHGLFQHALADALNKLTNSKVVLTKGQDPEGLIKSIPIWEKALKDFYPKQQEAIDTLESKDREKIHNALILLRDNYGSKKVINPVIDTLDKLLEDKNYLHKDMSTHQVCCQILEKNPDKISIPILIRALDYPSEDWYTEVNEKHVRKVYDAVWMDALRALRVIGGEEVTSFTGRESHPENGKMRFIFEAKVWWAKKQGVFSLKNIVMVEGDRIEISCIATIKKSDEKICKLLEEELEKKDVIYYLVNYGLDKVCIFVYKNHQKKALDVIVKNFGKKPKKIELLNINSKSTQWKVSDKKTNSIRKLNPVFLEACKECKKAELGSERKYVMLTFLFYNEKVRQNFIGLHKDEVIELLGEPNELYKKYICYIDEEGKESDSSTSFSLLLNQKGFVIDFQMLP